MRWTAIDANQADAPAARFGHVAVVVDARDDWGTELVILHGGVHKLPSEQEAFLDDVCIFQVEQEAWVRPQISSSASPGPRAFHSATAIDKGFLFFGGQALIPNTSSRQTFNDIWTLSVDSWTWRQLAIQSTIQPPPRSSSSMTSIESGRVLIFGGRNESSKALNDVWIFHVQQERWEAAPTVGDAPPARIKQSIAFANGILWLYGGETTNGTIYDDLWALHEDKTSGQWHWNFVRTKPKPIGRSGHCLTAMPDHRILCFGGQMGNTFYTIFSQSYNFTNEVWVFDTHLNMWSKLESPGDHDGPVERVFSAMAIVSSGRIFIFSGRGKDNVLGDTWRLELQESKESNTSSSQSIFSFVSSSAVPTLSSSEQPQMTSVRSDVIPTEDDTNSASYNTPLLGTVWSNFPTISSRGFFSRITTRIQPTGKQDHVSDITSTTEPKQHEMSVIDNGHDTIDAMESYNEGTDALYSYFGVDKEAAPDSPFAAQPDDHHLDLALLSHAQSYSPSFATSIRQRSQDSAIAAARELLMRVEAKEFKLGNIWLLLADYKRLLIKSDLLKGWKDYKPTSRPQLNTRFLHFTMETIRLSDLPELLLSYRRLIESLQS